MRNLRIRLNPRFQLSFLHIQNICTRGVAIMLFIGSGYGIVKKRKIRLRIPIESWNHDTSNLHSTGKSSHGSTLKCMWEILVPTPVGIIFPYLPIIHGLCLKGLCYALFRWSFMVDLFIISSFDITTLNSVSLGAFGSSYTGLSPHLKWKELKQPPLILKTFILSCTNYDVANQLITLEHDQRISTTARID